MEQVTVEQAVALVALALGLATVVGQAVLRDRARMRLLPRPPLLPLAAGTVGIVLGLAALVMATATATTGG